MKHSGEILKKIVDGSGVPISRIAKQLGVDRSTIYRTFDKTEIPLEFILKIGKIINKDMSVFFPEVLQAVQEAPTNYSSPKSYSELQDEAKYWKDKYIDVLEKYNKLLNDQLFAEKLKYSKSLQFGYPERTDLKKQTDHKQGEIRQKIKGADDDLSGAIEDPEE